MNKKSLFVLLILPICLHLFQLFFMHYNGTFTSRTFAHGFEKTYSQEVSGLDFAQLDAILVQPFFYLGQGKQMIAFVSADGKYVLKLFNPMRPLKKRWYTHRKYWQRYSSFKWLSREWLGKKVRLKKLFQRHKLAFELLKDETGLVFVHLHPTKRICHLVTIADKRGNHYRISLEQTPFILQKKAELVPSYFQQLRKENKGEQAKHACDSIKQLFEKRLQAGITDRIQTMENNYGFVEDRPIQIDVGRIRFDPNINREKERERILKNFHNWMKKNYDDFLH